jgi:hypothetical protein
VENGAKSVGLSTVFRAKKPENRASLLTDLTTGKFSISLIINGLDGLRRWEYGKKGVGGWGAASLPAGRRSFG